MNLGHAPSYYANSIPLCLNTETGSITPQFHVVFDNWFSTVASDPAQLPDFNSDEWNKLFGDSTFQYLMDPIDVAAMQELSEELKQSIDSSNAEHTRNCVMEAAERLRPSSSVTKSASTTWRESKVPSDRSFQKPTFEPSLHDTVSPPTQPSFTEPILPVIPPVTSTPMSQSVSSRITPAPAPTVAPSPPVAPVPPPCCSTLTSKAPIRLLAESAVSLAPPSHFQALFASINCSSQLLK